MSKNTRKRHQTPLTESYRAQENYPAKDEVREECFRISAKEILRKGNRQGDNASGKRHKLLCGISSMFKGHLVSLREIL